jgi:phosphatidylserine/phosphatidylglycerophosphate/cardiolipin synthase-like enzyme
MQNEGDKEVIANLRKIVAQTEHDLYQTKSRYMDTFFFPNKANVKKIVKYISMARKTLYICVFNVTNDDLCKAVLERHNAGINVKIITDDECSTNKGSDIQKFADAGIEVRTDSAPEYHMHDKFMVVDGTFVLTGSFNWTFQAGSSNQENVLVVDHPYYCEKYSTEFNSLWLKFCKNEVLRQQTKAATTIQKQYRSNKAKDSAKSHAKDPQANYKKTEAKGY